MTDSQRTLTVGLLGLGVVGSGVVQLLRDHAEEIAGRVGARLVVGPVVVRDPDKPREVAAELTTDLSAVVGAEGVDIVVEVMGGIDPARGLLADALAAGQSVVTANKELIATHGAELLAAAQERSVRLEYEAAVAGAIPIIKPMRESLAGDRVRKVLGILNGTTNYILTRMTEEGADLDPVLAEAQDLGYAEKPDPSADVDGHDAAAKAAILASLAFDAEVTRDQVFTEGIRGVTATDIANAERMGYVIKLLGIAEETEGPSGERQIGVRVHPAWVPAEHPLASVREAFNAIFVEAEGAGELMFYGRGAGSLPTASAVVGDVVTAARAHLAGEELPRVAISRKPIRPMDESIVQYYVLLDVVDRAGVLATVAATFGDNDVSIKSVWQEGSDDHAQLLLVTHAAREGNVQACVAALEGLSEVRRVASLMRVEGREV
ncbi:homoserine dehydrogenase [Euzebya tangerina]|uniref:homoserine dehydrogenase n=1 Tax=Euzebya tangerina TaxID=591198 RepID=UPI000E30D9FB|nr:homoserine dehydrogenase [Euzebya tangerina]